MKILCDIGGTFVRFAKSDGQNVAAIQKYEAADFASFADGLAAYCQAQEIDDQPAVLVASAGKMQEEGLWYTGSKVPWNIEIEALRAQGWEILAVRNDFEAAAWALAALDESSAEDAVVLKAGVGAAQTKCLIGPGTGLGLAYLEEQADKGYWVKKTNGAHMPVPIRNEEQFEIMKTLEAGDEFKDGIVMQDLVSGRGLHHLYKVCCTEAGDKLRFEDDRMLFEYIETTGAELDETATRALRLFHEFFGLYAQTVVICGDAYGGVYLTGGVTKRLMDCDHFDLKSFEQFLTDCRTASVREDLEKNKIVYVKESYPALKGLLVEQRLSQSGAHA